MSANRVIAEALESRVMWSAAAGVSPPAAGAQYTADPRVTLLGVAEDKRVSDPIELDFQTVSAGAVSGSYTEPLSAGGSFTGTMVGDSLTIDLENAAGGSGTIVCTAVGRKLVGKLSEQSIVTTNQSWSGNIALRPARIPSLVGQYQADTAAQFYNLSAYNTLATASGSPVQDKVKLNITSEAGSAIGGSLTDDFDAIQISGTLLGRTLTFANAQTGAPITSGTFHLPAGGGAASLHGSFYVQDWELYEGVERKGVLTLKRAKSAANAAAPDIVGVYNGTDQEVDTQNAGDAGATISGPNADPVTLTITSQSPDGSVAGQLALSNGGDFDKSVAVTGTVTGDQLSLQGGGSTDFGDSWTDSVAGIVDDNGKKITASISTNENDGLPQITIVSGSVILART